MEGDKEKLDKKLKEELGDKNINDLYKKSFINIPTKEYSDIRELVIKQAGAKGLPSEIFANLKIELNKILNTEIPEDRIRLYREWEVVKKEYDALVEKLK